MAQGPSTLGLFLPLIIMTLPIVFLNGVIARNKGKNAAVFSIFSIIPFVGFYLMIYLLSLPDYSLKIKIDKILNKLDLQ